MGSAAEDICYEVMKEAVEKVVILNEGNRDLSVTIDRMWQKHDHTFLNEFISATSVDSDKVIDGAILSKHCHCKDKFTGQHDNKCSANYHGLSDGMELSGPCQTLKGPITI